MGNYFGSNKVHPMNYGPRIPYEERSPRRRFTDAERDIAWDRGFVIEGEDPDILRHGADGHTMHRDTFHLDHIIPHARGGRNHMVNIQPLHGKANMRRGDKQWTPWFEENGTRGGMGDGQPRRHTRNRHRV
jgi:hypothetical protein